MVRVRDSHWVALLSAAIGLAVFIAVLLGATAALAEPADPTGQTEIATPVTPPKPQPCEVGVKCLPPVNPCLLSPEVCDPLVDPGEPPMSEPSQPAEPPATEPGDQPTTKPPKTRKPLPQRVDVPVVQPEEKPSIIPTPTRVDTGGGPVSEPPMWLFWAVPGMALLTLGAGVAGWRMARSEESRP